MGPTMKLTFINVISDNLFFIYLHTFEGIVTVTVSYRGRNGCTPRKPSYTLLATTTICMFNYFPIPTFSYTFLPLFYSSANTTATP